MILNFQGKKALVLGGSCDLALTLAAAMTAAGIFPLLTFRSEEGREKIDARLSPLGGKYDAAYLNFGDRDSLASLLSRWGGEIDFVVDFAQGDFEGYIAAADEGRVYQYFNDNVSFRAELLKKIARIMLKRGKGRFVFISSVAAGRANPGQGFYAAAKLAAEALYRNLGLELGRKGITAVTLRPGYIRAGRGEAYLEAHGEEALRLVPTGRFLTEGEVAETILFLLSESAAGFNATELTMDGGLTAGK
ncbi:MAG TPA: short-chain dehydrogenase [Syntrophus sp. (in: bacteria)]|jgi:3-oxoacyl-[acyl-carrier protein] reductase|nr:short-chain dehydrogenase [Syntrophus sp. (in: bacteria)]